MGNLVEINAEMLEQKIKEAVKIELSKVARKAVEEQIGEDGAYAIVVLDKGFVYVGNLFIAGDWLVIRNCRNIRRWGTERGLGELALHGTRTETVLDEVGTLRAPLHALLHYIYTEEGKWTD